ncbi:hypothetical protein TW78_21970 [Vibrio coralliilyticus]|uniref:Uncharacterized protein n=2 Tax=Vibrio coralliilyticus TaxID=190893 RepID=A0A837G9B2_9VIBR|nr:hypothetical protein [Vibrio coralliilyticus]KJY67983.1 hypothetical protein TW78_21970 [Vibrio coralliilyticus]QOU32085.1 hypothetical protein TW71_022960 [Vibrio coralliilyticus]
MSILFSFTVLRRASLFLITTLSLIMWPSAWAACTAGSRVGDANWQFDVSRYDERFPLSIEWAKAGVRGGIPCFDPERVVAKITPKDDIQTAIDKVARAGGGTIILEEGIYRLAKTVEMRSNVVLRGSSKIETQVLVTMRNTWQGYGTDRFAFQFSGVSGAGLENMTIQLAVDGFEPLDRNNFDEPHVESAWPFTNDVKVARTGDKNKPISDPNLYVGLVKFSEKSHDSWVQDTRMLEAGTNPIFAASDTSHLTFRGNDIYRCYNKGINGHCYYDIRGQYILVTNERVRKIRHVTLHQQAKYNVVYDNHLEVDVNFHNGDGGKNLVENNLIQLPWSHHWPLIATGELGKHQAPGAENLIYRNNVAHLREGKNNIPNSEKVYTLAGFDEVIALPSHLQQPKAGTLYPMKHFD